MRIRPNLFGRLFGSVKYIELTDSELIIACKAHSSRNAYSELSGLPRTERRLYGDTLVVVVQAAEINIRFLRASDVRKASHILKREAADNLQTQVTIATRIVKNRMQFEYLRDSSISTVETALTPLLEKYIQKKNQWNKLINEESIHSLSVFEKFMPLEQSKFLIRKKFEKKALKLRQDFFDDIETNPLTAQQRKSVVRNNDLNLILAAAGTGKTSVMVAKAIDLIDSGRASGDEILVLAFNKAAAEELKQRVYKRGGPLGIEVSNGPSVSTFHALGRNVLKESRVPVHMSVMTEDRMKLNTWVTEWLRTYIQSSSLAMRNFILLSYQPVNAFNFKTREEYEAYSRDTEYRTLQGDLVKGYQEWLIANWLFEQGVAYEYESPYVSKRRIDDGIDYKPDFHITGTDIYLEHFGIARDGSTRADIDSQKYNESIVYKRDLHAECGTTLLETYHYDWEEKNLESRLAFLVESNDIATSPKSSDEILEVLNDGGFIDDSAKRYMKCLQAIRGESLDKQSTHTRLVDSKIVFASKYSELLSDLHDGYVAELKVKKSIDFDDMIIRSTQQIVAGRYKPCWKHILVDEFQDISMARMTFLRALIDHGPRPTLTAVGDDWQSIYRFSGGKLELTTRFESLVGQHTVTKLEKTFRYNNSIAETAGTFVMQNPEQYRKDVVAHEHVNSPRVFLLDTTRNANEQLEDRIVQTIRTIKEQDSEGTIAVIARYNYLLRDAREQVVSAGNSKRVYYWTFHGSKGLEADYCILIGFFSGKSGFPNGSIEEAVVEALLPTLDNFAYSEERRLMYVGLTRARKRTYLIADAATPSVFINELLSPLHDIHILSKAFEEKYRKVFKCPQCAAGFFQKLSGKYGDYYRCTSGSGCTVKPRICKKCGSPSVDRRQQNKCNNEACRELMAICDICGRPMKERNGTFGKFLGCSGYGIPDDQCRNTRRLH